MSISRGLGLYIAEQTRYSTSIKNANLRGKIRDMLTLLKYAKNVAIATQLTDDGPVYHALSVHLSRAKLITRSTIDMPRRNSLSPEFGTEGGALIFVDT